MRVRISLLTILSPKIIEHQNKTLLSSVRPLTHLLLWTMTMGICSIMAKNPYPLNFLVMQPMTSSCASADMRKVIVVATGRDMWFLDAE